MAKKRKKQKQQLRDAAGSIAPSALRESADAHASERMTLPAPELSNSASLEDNFFDAPVTALSTPMPMAIEATPDRRVVALMSEAARARRTRFARYVKGIVAVALALCAMAAVRVSLRHAEGTSMAATSSVAPAPPQSATTSAIAVAAPSAIEVSAPPSAALRAPSPAASSHAMPELVADIVDPKAAAREKKKSQQLLEQGRTHDAIAHGMESVRLDPADGEAWLILGAAYQMVGDFKEARRAFASCLKEGKRGPRGECAAMSH